MKNILVLEGGGAMGLAQLKFLTRLEQESGKKISDIFDLIVGTSVGSITGGVLSLGMSANEFYPIFRNGLDDIFKTHWYKFGVLNPKYDRKNFKKLWDRIFYKPVFLSDVKVPFMCTAVDRADDTNFYFKSWKDKYSNWDLSYVIQASFAAPYYFGQLVDYNHKRIWFDGGVGIANCPLDQAYTETESLGWGNVKKCFTVVGCGLRPDVNRDAKFNKYRKQNVWGQIMDFVSPMSGGIARKQATKDVISRYNIIERFDDNLELRYVNVVSNVGSIDDVSENTKIQLEEVGEQMMQYCINNGWEW